jgi:ribosomal protein L12E/L44/L45/RPP1/RPP2
MSAVHLSPPEIRTERAKEQKRWEQKQKDAEQNEDDEEESYDYSESGSPLPPGIPPPGKRLAPVGACREENEGNAPGAKDSRLNSTTSSNGGSGDLTFMLLPSSAAAMASAAEAESAAERNKLLMKRKLQEMEEEQEELNNSLMGITSHFAQVRLNFDQKALERRLDPSPR